MSYFNKRIFLRAGVFALLLLSGFSLPASHAESGDVLSLDEESINAVRCDDVNCFFPGKGDKNRPFSSRDIHIIGSVKWTKSQNLVLHTRGNIVFREGSKLIIEKDASLVLKSGMEPGKKGPYDKLVKFEGNSIQIIMLGKGKVKIYYNPHKGTEEHKYHNPVIYGKMLPGIELETYMLVNNIYDLQGITACLYGSFALSQNIDASPTRRWNYLEGSYRGFFPIMNYLDRSPFSGTLDGNNYEIDGLFIYRPDEPNVGLFGDVTGVNEYKSTIKNFTLVNSSITGKRCVGGVVGQATGIKLSNLKVPKNKNEIHSVWAESQKESGVSGIVAGCVLDNNYEGLSREENGPITTDDAALFGSCVRCHSDTIGTISERLNFR